MAIFIRLSFMLSQVLFLFFSLGVTFFNKDQVSDLLPIQQLLRLKGLEDLNLEKNNSLGVQNHYSLPREARLHLI